MHDTRPRHMLDAEDVSDMLRDHAEASEDDVPSAGVAETYDRLAPFYDWLQAPVDVLGGSKRRARIIRGAVGDVLEIGVGTGLSLGLYASSVRLMAIDVSAGMLEQTRARAARLNRSVDVRLASVECLPFASASFDTVTGTCVFSSVEHPLRGLQEARRVVRPDGQLRLLEHVRPRRAVLGTVFDYLSPVTRRLLGTEINRDIEGDVQAAGFEILRVRRSGIWREIVARPGPDARS